MQVVSCPRAYLSRNQTGFGFKSGWLGVGAGLSDDSGVFWSSACRKGLAAGAPSMGWVAAWRGVVGADGDDISLLVWIADWRGIVGVGTKGISSLVWSFKGGLSLGAVMAAEGGVAIRTTRHYSGTSGLGVITQLTLTNSSPFSWRE